MQEQIHKDENNNVCLFVYGTLRPTTDASLGRYLRRGLLSVCDAKARGLLFDLGSFPGARFDEQHPSEIIGHIVSLKEEILGEIDAYEGYSPSEPAHSLYIRKPVRVRTDAGKEILCWTYEYNQWSGNEPEIVNGDFLNPTYTATG